MIPNAWYPLVEGPALRGHRAIAARRLERDWVVWRDAAGVAHAFPDRCPHRAARLSGGRIERGALECPYHGLRFDGRGRCIDIPAHGAQAPIPAGLDVAPATLREQHGLVWIWYGAERDAKPELPWLDDLDPPPGPVCTRTLLAPVSYLRVMENMTDVAHFPFVHRRRIPVGRRIADFDARAEGDVIRVRGRMLADTDRGRDFPFDVRVRMPGVATFDVLPGVQFVVTVTPVDRDRCWMWARYSQGWLPAWLGGGLLTRLVAMLDLGAIFRAQDLPVLASQRLDPPEDVSGYHLLDFDRGAALYFSLRQQALRDAGSTRDVPASPAIETSSKVSSLGPPR